MKKTNIPNLLSAVVPKDMDSERVDIVATKLFPELNRTKLRGLIDGGMVFLNKKRIWIAKYAVKTKDILEINSQNGDKQRAEFTAKNILFENDYFLIINKPPGIAVEDAKHNFPIFKLINALIPSEPDENFYVVHRLDKDTSGLLIVAKTPRVQQDMVALWSQKKVQKMYQAVCFGVPKKLQGTINSNIGQHAGRNQYGTSKKREEGGKTALTNYKVNMVLQKGQACIMGIEPKTGRSHQIRVHLASIDCPILGDKIYGSKFKLHMLYQIANRQMLHASQLIFELYGSKYNFHATVPSDFNQLIKFIKTSKLVQKDNSKLITKDIGKEYNIRKKRKHSK